MATIWKKKKANKKLLDYGPAAVKQKEAPLSKSTEPTLMKKLSDTTGAFGEMKSQLTFLGHRLC